MCNIIRLDSIVICQHMYNITFDDVTNVLETEVVFCSKKKPNILKVTENSIKI